MWVPTGVNVRWLGVSVGGLDGSVVSLVSPKWVSCGLNQMHSIMERHTELE